MKVLADFNEQNFSAISERNSEFIVETNRPSKDKQKPELRRAFESTSDRFIGGDDGRRRQVVGELERPGGGDGQRRRRGVQDDLLRRHAHDVGHADVDVRAPGHAPRLAGGGT